MPIKILMPALSPTMTEGNLVKWHKKEGDVVEVGDILAEIETDKATMEVEAIDEGKLGKIYVPEGAEDVKVNTLIAALLEEGEDASSLDGLAGNDDVAASNSSQEATQQTKEQQQEQSLPTSAEATNHTLASAASDLPSHDARIFASPLAKRLAQEKGVALNAIAGSGPHGRIIKEDVVNAKPSAAAPTSTASASSSSFAQSQSIAGGQIGAGIEGTSKPADDLYPGYIEQKLSNMRKVIAKRLTEAKQTVPHFYLTVDCELDALLKARAELNADLEKSERISVNDFIIKAMATALKAVPEANASFAGDHIKIFERADISVAVAIDGGLVTPIIRGAEQKSLGQLSFEMKGLIQKARDGKLRPEEFQGGTISLSNLGMFGINQFSAVINPPQGCILAVGAGVKKPVALEDGSIKVATVMTCTLSVDHRVVDGAVGARFLDAFKKAIQSPVRMLF